jgi:cell division protein FtsB
MGPGESFVAITFLLVVGAYFVTRGEIGRAIAQAIRAASGTADADARADIDQLRLEVHELRQELTEAQERIDFAERLLAHSRNVEQLPPGGR